MTEYKITSKNNIVYGPPLHEKTPKGGIGWFIKTQCEKFADREMQFCPYENKTITFGEFNEKSLNLASNIQQLFNVNPGDIILCCMKNTIYNGIPVAAAFYLNAIISTIDPTLSVRDCQHMVNLVKPKVIVLDEDCLPLMQETLKGINYDTNLIINGDDKVDFPFYKLSTLLHKNNRTFEPVYVHDEQTPALILFSSGTSGLPKGICQSQKSTYLNGFVFIELSRDAQCIMHYTTLYWISAMGIFIRQFISGCKRISLRNFDPLLNCQIIDQCKVDTAFMATSALHSLLDMKQYEKKYDLSSFKSIIFGGSATDANTLIRIQSEFPNLVFIHGYGMTEVSLISGCVPELMEKKRFKGASCGPVARGVILKIIDLETGKVLGPNEKGQICVKTDRMLLKYWKSPENPLDEDGFVKTGDVGHYDEDYWVYVYDRIKDMFKYKSWHIVPASLENVIKEHPNVDEAVIFGIEHKTDGFLPTAAVTLKNKGETTSEEIAEFVAARVADRQRLRGGVFILQEIQKTPSGKVLRRKIQEQIVKGLLI